MAKKEELVFLGREISEQRDYSEQVCTGNRHRNPSGLIQEAYAEAKKPF